MDGSARDDIRKLLKEFGVRADETVIAYLSIHSDLDSLDLRLTLEDRTDYGASPPDQPLHLEVDGTIRRRN